MKKNMKLEICREQKKRQKGKGKRGRKIVHMNDIVPSFVSAFHSELKTQNQENLKLSMDAISIAPSLKRPSPPFIPIALLPRMLKDPLAF